MKSTRLFHLLLVSLFLVFNAGPALAQEDTFAPLFEEKEAVTAESYAEDFFRDCYDKPIIRSSDETTMAFCACSSAQLQSWMQEQKSDRKLNLLNSSATAELTDDVLLTEIYAPCLYVPRYEEMYDKCMVSPKAQYFMNKPGIPEKMCDCTAKGDADYFEHLAAPYLQKEIAQGKEIVDPIEQITQDIAYYDAMYTLERQCFKKWANE